MDMALAARGDFLVVSVLEPSGRATAAGVVFAEGAGTLALVGADLAAVVTVLEVAFEETVFLRQLFFSRLASWLCCCSNALWISMQISLQGGVECASTKPHTASGCCLKLHA